MSKWTKKARDAARTATSAALARRRAADKRSAMTRRVSGLGGSYLLGRMAASGTLERIPTVFGLPRLAVVGVLGFVAGEYVSGTAGDALEGLGDAALAIAAYQMGSGAQVAGDDIVSGDGQLPEWTEGGDEDAYAELGL